ncbi:hypothetical protein RRG08_063351 [Elysia crispata]|uniref:Uncharacterized protein n=1 Tax=Elysia crispata TaxID=231223 RepID=A0AAE1B2E3_9GAST|nr:hypothetical protein RRG08_063351 [Elysia crispata]
MKTLSSRSFAGVYTLLLLFITFLALYTSRGYLDTPHTAVLSRGMRKEKQFQHWKMDKLEPSPDSGTQPPLLDSLQISQVDGPETSVERTVTKPYSYNTENGTVGPRSDVLEPEAERSRADADATETYVEDPESDVQGLENGSNAAGSDVARTVLTSNASMVPELARKLRETLELPNDSNPRKIKLLCGHIDYRKNTYKFHKPCLQAKCNERFNRTYEDRLKDVLLSPRYQLNGSQLEAILSLGRDVRKSDVIIASAVSSNHYNEMQMMFKNLHETVFPTLRNFQVILFDIGLSPEERRQTEKKCRCQVITFNFDLFPPHVLDRHCYAWKPLIVRALIARAKKLVIWQDASVRWMPRFKVILERAKVYGLQMFVGGGDKVTANTLRETFEYMQEQECVFESVSEIANAVALFRADVFNTLAVLTPWSRCALEPSCICPQDPAIVRYCRRLRPQRCHRFDQSALTLFLGKLFYDQRYKIEIQEHHKHVDLQRNTVAPDYFQKSSR